MLGWGQIAQRAVEPAIVSGLHARSATLHEILRVKVRARRVRRSRGMHDGQMTLLPQRLKRRQRRMQSKAAVEVEHRLARDIDAGPHGVVLRLRVRHNNVQPIGGATLKNDDQTPVARARIDRAKSRAREEARYGCRTDDGQCAVAKEDATCDGHENAPGYWPLTLIACATTLLDYS